MNDTEKTIAPWKELGAHIERHFQTATNEECLLWIDPVHTDPFENHPLIEKRRIRVPIRHPRFEPSRAPYVVPLNLSQSADAEVFNASVELAWRSWDLEQLSAMLGQPVCGWVSTRATAKSVAAHWGRHCHLHILPRKAKLLRFHDPGVREWLWPSLSKTQQRALFGPVTAVHAIGRGQLLTHQRCTEIGTQSIGQNEAGQYPALILDEEQWDQLDDYANVHSAWLTWCAAHRGAPAVLGEPGWERPIFRALRQATRVGLRDAADRELFALHALQLGAGFYQNAILQDVWHKTEVGIFYSNAVEEITGRPADQLGAFILAKQGNRHESKHG